MPSPSHDYWIDQMGAVWFGPLANGFFTRFDGIDPKSMRIIWTRFKLDKDVKLYYFAKDRWDRLLMLYIADARKRRPKEK